jgi:hypothetical protein
VGETNEIVYQPESNGIKPVIFDYYDEYRIDTMPDLLEGNIEAYAVRQNFFVKKQSNYYHKGFNHILRMIYLLELSIHVGEYEKYKKNFFNLLIQKFSKEHIINKILFPEKEDPEFLKKQQEEEEEEIKEELKQLGKERGFSEALVNNFMKKKITANERKEKSYMDYHKRRK